MMGHFREHRPDMEMVEVMQHYISEDTPSTSDISDSLSNTLSEPKSAEELESSMASAAVCEGPEGT